MRLILPAILLALAAGPGAAKVPDTHHRDVLIALAGVLGESHALRQACAGPEDQFWRARMLRLMEVEQPAPALEARLMEAFNAEFAAHKQIFTACSPAAKHAETAAAVRGRTLAGQLSQRSQQTLPDGMADGAVAR